MSLIVKIMSGEDIADDDSRKQHRLFYGVTSIHFERLADGVTPYLSLGFGPPSDAGFDGLAFEPNGNVYVMNEAGRTVDIIGVSPLSYPPTS